MSETNLTLEEAAKVVARMGNKIDYLEESLADVQLALDDIGWKPLGGDVDATEIPLDTVKGVAQTTRALLAINPLIKRGIAVRTTYIWGQGVKFEGIPEDDEILTDPTNQKFIFSPEAQTELEACMATDGNLFVLVTKLPKVKLTRVPMSQITGTVTDPSNAEDIWFYRRQWTETVNTFRDGDAVRDRIAFYPAADYDWQVHGKPRTIRDKPVIWESAILENKANKQVGWKWGVADLMSVVFWSKAYKEFLENSATLVKAYSRYAFKVTAQSRAGVNAASTKVAEMPTRDPYSGEVQSVGSTAVMGNGTTLSPIGRTGGSVDFEAGLPLAAMVAAGLEIPLTTLTSDGGNSNRSGAETLNEPTIKAMQARQQLWSGFYRRLFNYLDKPNVKVIWGRMSDGDIQRAIQAVVAAVPRNVLSAEEVRALFVAILGLQEGSMPTEEELGLMLEANTTAGKEAAELAKKAAENPAPVVGGDGKPKPKPPAKTKNASQSPSYGDNGARNAVGQNKYTQGRNN